MLISLNWIKKYVDIDIDNDELVKLIGSRLVEVEDAIDQTHKYDKIYAVEVKYCEAIEGTHLHLCKIDDGGRADKVERDENGYVQVMCGAPNVRKGMFAAWIAPGAIVPASVHEDAPFVIGMRKMLKKYDSYGMMAGADELDLGDDHTGIVELNPATTKAGDDFAQLFELDDIILDIENKSLTHRPDTFGIIGFAREVAGILGKPFKTPDWYLATKASFENSKDIQVDIEISDSQLCPRYVALVMEPHGKAEHKYLSFRDTLLARSGMRPIDPIVDASNYLMLLSGQPTHTFDYDKFIAVGGTKTPKIGVRLAKKGEKLVLLDGKEVELVESDIVIASNDTPVALAGAMGGKDTEIDENTKRVIVESATFSLFNLRKTQMNHGIFSEAITRFTKGQPSAQTLPVALEFANEVDGLMRPVAVFDSQKTAPKAEKVTVSVARINGLLGTNYSIDEIVKTLQNVEFTVEQKDDSIVCTAPQWRTDIHIAEDIIEEIGRLNGYDNISPILPLHGTADADPCFALRRHIRDFAASRGANEVLTYSFVHGDLMRKVGQNPDNAYRIVNSISPDLQYIRQTIVPSLLDKSYANMRGGYEKFALFEMNQTYPRTNGLDEQNVPNGSHSLALICVGKGGSNYYLAKKYLEQLLASLGIEFEIAPFVAVADKTNAYYEPKRSASIIVDGVRIGDLGELKAKVAREFKLPLNTAAFELDLGRVLESQQAVTRKNFRISQYPFVMRDITLELPIERPYGEIEQQLRATLEAEQLIYRLKATSIFRAEGETQKKISFHIEFSHPDRTLAKTEIQVIMEKLEQVK